MGILSIFKRKKEYTKPMCTAVIVAAGNSSRMGEDKLFMLLGGIPVLAHALIPFNASPLIDRIVVVTRSEKIVLVQDVCREFGITKVSSIITGGRERTDSVLAGVVAAGECELVAIHDGARPFVTEEIISDTFAAAEEFGAAAPGVPVKDTIKIVKDGIVQSTPDRRGLFAIQTPQIFNLGLIKGALTKAKNENKSYPDDCAAVEAMGMSIHITPGSYRNLKITTVEDITAAEALLDEENE